MSESEFDIIKTYFSLVGASLDKPDWLIAGIGDDAAVINPHSKEQLLISVDTLNAGIHFPDSTLPADIGYKALAVNISDIAAMGGKPIWFTLAISLPSVDHDWLKSFCTGLSEIATQHNLKLVGGDTTKGPLSITIQIAGQAPAKQSLKRSGANVGDDVYVTGTLGDAAAGLKLLQLDQEIFDSHHHKLIDRLNRPSPRVEVGLALRELATACIDISDGLSGDLGHILEASRDANDILGAEVDIENIPLSESLQQSGLTVEAQNGFALHGGDDFELCFTAPESERAVIETISQQVGCRITNIGKIIQERGLFAKDKKQRKAIIKTGFDHFGES